MTIGEILAGVRREQGKSIEDVEKATKIRGRYIELIESNQFQLLPGDTYARAFIKSYANFLEVDSKPFLKQYGLQWGQTDSRPSGAASQKPKFLPPKMEKRGPRSRGRVRRYFVGLAAGLLVVTGAIWVLGIRVGPPTGEKGVTTEADSDTVSDDLSRPVTSRPEETTSAPSTTLLPTVLKIKISALERSWVLVETDGEQVFQGVMEKDEARDWQADKEVFIWAGRGELIEVERNGTPIGRLTAEAGIAKRTFTLGEDGEVSSSGE